MKYRLLCALFALGFSSNALADSCSSRDKDKAEYYAEKAADKLVDNFGGGQDLVVKLVSCSFNSYSKVYKTGIEIYWNGSIFRSNHYNIDGVLKMNKNGGNIEFSQTYANQAVKDLEFWQNAAVGAIVVGVVASEMSDN